jgi:hypothetical protein
MRDGEERSRKFAKRLRKSLTDAETIMWSYLRRDRVEGMRFRKQHPIGPFVADFAFVKAMLIVEIDGATHNSDEQVAYDARRTAPPLKRVRKPSVKARVTNVTRAPSQSRASPPAAPACARDARRVWETARGPRRRAPTIARS